MARRSRSWALGALSSISALTSISLRGHPSIVIEPTGAPTIVNAPPYPTRRLSCRIVVRVNRGADSVGCLSFCAATGAKMQKLESKARARTKSALLFTETDCAGESKSCLAAQKLYLALVVRDG